jgi:hypothetical protein
LRKYKIELSEEQLRLVSFCLEDVSRFASGQWEMRYTIEEMLRGLPFAEQMKRKAKAQEQETKGRINPIPFSDS